ncbi:MAG TPA: hypothetical protein VIW69_13830 [Candidatus Elarobacter sp.]
MPRAIAHVAVIVACAMMIPVGLGGPAGAQVPAPSPNPNPNPSASPVPTPIAFTAHAHANVTVVTASATFNGSLQLGIAQRTNLTRIDVLGVKSDSIPIPPIGVTAVVDRAANTLTIWNDVTKQYAVQSFIPSSIASPTPRASASPRATAAPRGRTSPFANLDVLSVTMKLTGHTTTIGLPSTGFSYDLQVQHKGDKAPMHVMATTQFADEFFIFPLLIDLSVEPGSSPFSTKLSYAVDDLTREVPPLSRFAVPAGYTKAHSLPEMIFQRRPSPRPSATPVPKAS